MTAKTGAHKAKVPRLAMRVVNEHAYCGRCGGPLGPIHGGVLRLDNLGTDPTDRGAWVLLGASVPFEYAFRRRRRPNTASGVTNAIGGNAWPGGIVECPNAKCRGRQVVPLSR